MLPECPGIISILFFCLLSGSFSSEILCALWCFRGYTVLGVAERIVWIEPVRKPCVLQCLRGCEETRLGTCRRVNLNRTVGLLLASRGMLPVSHPCPPIPFLLSPPSPGRRPAVRRKPLNTSWNPFDLCFDGKRTINWWLVVQNRGHSGSRYT